MQPIIECVPNFSDGRRPEVYGAIAEAIRRVPGAHVLDVSADPDHNRSVITFVGDPAAVEEGAYRAIAKAAELIDLERHQGEHPRIGATDVCPFIPVSGATVVECVELARRLGQRVGDELGIAVYLYGAAATRPEREKLANIRRGEYEQWKVEVGVNPQRAPDFGPARPEPWGATVIGVRPFLIAYNIYLNSDRIENANQIARAIRHSSGGLREVQALGFLVEGQAQVSMNLTDFKTTPIYRVQELVRREAAHYGLSITHAELVGMAPESAFLDVARWYLQLEKLGDEQVLELKLAQTAAADFTPSRFIDATASAEPTPGGGSTAAAAGALGAALAEMVAGLTVGRKKYVAVETESQKILVRAADLRQALTRAVADDAQAFVDLMAAWRNKEGDETTRQQGVEAATRHAAEVPLNVARQSREVAELAAQIARLGNANAVSDAAAGAIMARAAVQIAALNVKINATSLADQDIGAEWRGELDRLEAETMLLAEQAIATAAERANF